MHVNFPPLRPGTATLAFSEAKSNATHTDLWMLRDGIRRRTLVDSDSEFWLNLVVRLHYMLPWL
jgi:hypothetical protein